MSEFYFFTEPDKLQTQTAEQAFGPVDENNYRLGNMFSASSDPRAFAISSGQVLAQAVTGSSTLLNLIITTPNQPNLDLPKISYIMYKGILKSSLISGNTIAAASKNDLTNKIWDSFNEQTNNLPNPPLSPNANEILGLTYNALASGNFKAEDIDHISKAFYNTESVLFPIEAGDYIGDFQQSALGIIIVFETIGFNPTFKMARELDSLFTTTALAGDASNSATFKLKHDKEKIINFLDSSAFFGAFTQIGLKASDDSSFVDKKEDALYNDIIQKHHNKNKLYLDIRNEYGDSFNYYENYSNTIYIDSSGEEKEKNYYSGSWPMFSISDVDFKPSDSKKNFKVGLPIGDNEFPQIYLKSGYLKNLETIPKKGEKYLSFEQLEEKLVINPPLKTLKKSSGGNIIANYYQLKYIKRYATPESNYKGKSLKKESYLDNLFPIFDLKNPYVNEGSLDIKIFYDSGYVDKANINETDFGVNLGIARDSETINFIASPNNYNLNEYNNRELIPLTGEQSFTEGNFIDYFNRKIGNYSIKKKTFSFREGGEEFLSFGVNEDTSNTEQEASLNYEAASVGKNYDLENTNIVSLTKEQFDLLKIQKEARFTAPYKVYLGITSTKYLTADEDAFAKTVFCLRGLKELDNGNIEPLEYVSDIEVFAEDDLYSWDENTETARVVDILWVDQNGEQKTNLPYGSDIVSIRIQTKDAIGKELELVLKWKVSETENTRPLKKIIISENETLYTFEFDYLLFGGGEPNIKEFYIGAKVGNGKMKDFANADGERLRVHAVRYVPVLMRNFNWPNSIRTQEEWFNNDSNVAFNTVDPKLNFVTIDWLLTFQRAKEEYDEIVTNRWKTSNGIESLTNEIIKMKNDGLFGWPTASESKIVFGTFSSEIVNHQNEKKPLFEKYFYTSLNHEIDKIPVFDGDGLEPKDDLFGTLGAFNWHVAAKGELIYLSEFTIEVKIQKLLIFAKDKFDFATEEEYLGHWAFLGNGDLRIVPPVPPLEVAIPVPFYNRINNRDYRNYRNEISKGYNYNLYSETIELDVEHSFPMGI